jgi:hypothetical protein
MNQTDSFYPVSSAAPKSPTSTPLHLDGDPAHHFYQSCDQDTQGLLWDCTWVITTVDCPTLLIKCPSTEIYWHILTSLTVLAERMALFSFQARIRVYPPIGQGDPLEVGVKEVTAHQGH